MEPYQSVNMLVRKGKGMLVMARGFAGSIVENRIDPEKIIDNKRFTCYYNVCKILQDTSGFVSFNYTEHPGREQTVGMENPSGQRRYVRWG
jgi:hypothetical protein